MKIGDLRKQMTLQAEQQTSDGAGGYALAWVDVATVWADIAPVGGNEYLAAGRLEAQVTHKITLRWRPDITPNASMRLTYGARLFNIRAVLNPGEANRWLSILAQEGVAV